MTQSHKFFWPALLILLKDCLEAETSLRLSYTPAWGAKDNLKIIGLIDVFIFIDFGNLFKHILTWYQNRSKIWFQMFPSSLVAMCWVKGRTWWNGEKCFFFFFCYGFALFVANNAIFYANLCMQQYNFLE